MTVTQAQIDIAERHGLTNVEALAEACDRTGLPFFLACTILQKETGGANIYGHDRGGVFTINGDKTVTEENYREFKRRIKAGETSNGVGPMQLTWKGYFLGPDSIESRGLRPWHAGDNILYGVSILAGTWKSSKGSIYEVGRAYNGARAYGLATVALAKVWKNRVGTVDLEQAPEPTDIQNGTVVKHSAKWGADYVSWKGEGWVTVKDHAILTALDAESQSFWHGLHLTQGGISTSVSASAGTHDGLGAFDVRTKFNSKAEVWELAAMFNRSGIVAFPRGYNLGLDFFRNNKHIHAVSRESYDSLHPSAKSQYQEFDRGGDGLVGGAKYTGPLATLFGRWKDSPYNPANITEDTANYWVSVSDGFLWGLDVDREKVTSRDKGAQVVAVNRVQRWGRANVVDAAGLYWAADYLTTTEPEEKP